MKARSQKLRVSPGNVLHGLIQVPGDKSITQRAMMLAALAEGETVIHNAGRGHDSLSTLSALESLGVEAEWTNGSLRIHGKGLRGLRAPTAPLDLGNSGTGMRLLMGILAGQSFDTTLKGDASLSRRPMRRVAEPLQKMGAKITLHNGETAPVSIQGRALSGIEYTLPVASAQLKTAVLFAGLFADGHTTVIEPVLTRDHTERLFPQFGVALKQAGNALQISKTARLEATTLLIPQDFSAAAFFIVAALITPESELRFSELGINPTRTGLLEVLEAMGADIRVDLIPDTGFEPLADVRVRTSSLQGVEVPTQLVPKLIDEFPALCIAAACAKGKTTFRGAAELRHKESDRIQAIAALLNALNIKTDEHPDGLTIYGGVLDGGTVNASGDHRIAMAAAMAGSVANHPVTLVGAEAIGVSFPGFVETACSVGMNIQEL